MSVSTTHSAYDLAASRWKVVRDASDAEKVRKGKSEYLPHLSDHKDNAARYDEYHKRGYYVNVTGRTREGLVGAAFKKPPKTELPNGLEFALEDINGASLSLEQAAKQCVGELLEVGRYGLLVDYPEAEEGATREQVAGLRPYVAAYEAENVLNWRETYDNGQLKTHLVVLREYDEKQVDEFKIERKERYRVLRLTDGVYTQQLYDDTQTAITEPKAITKPDGSTWERIPFHFAGSVDNRPSVDRSPLYDIAVINLAQYRNITDREETLHIAGQPTLFLGGEASAKEFEQMNPNGVQVGARKGHWLGANANAMLLQAQAVDAHDTAIQNKADQMVSLGARLITVQGGNQTAEAARIQASGEHSALSTIVANASEAFKAALRDMAEFIGANPDEVVFEISQDFWEENADPQLIMAMIQMADRGDIAQKDLRDYSRKTGLLAEGRTDEAIEQDVSQQGIG